jgi:hypothetical protein
MTIGLSSSCFLFLGAKNRQKGDTAQIFARKTPFFFLKSIRQTAPLLSF